MGSQNQWPEGQRHRGLRGGEPGSQRVKGQRAEDKKPRPHPRPKPPKPPKIPKPPKNIYLLNPTSPRFNPPIANLPNKSLPSNVLRRHPLLVADNPCGNARGTLLYPQPAPDGGNTLLFGRLCLFIICGSVLLRHFLCPTVVNLFAVTGRATVLRPS